MVTFTVLLRQYRSQSCWVRGEQTFVGKRRVFFLQLAADPSHLLHIRHGKKNEKSVEEKLMKKDKRKKWIEIVIHLTG